MVLRYPRKGLSSLIVGMTSQVCDPHELRTLGEFEALEMLGAERTRHEPGGRHRRALSPACPERAAADAGPHTTAEHAVVARSPHSSDQMSCLGEVRIREACGSFRESARQTRAREVLPGPTRSCVWHVLAGTCCLRPSGVRLRLLQQRDNARQDRSHG